MIQHKSLRLAPNFYCYVWMGNGNNCNTSLWCDVLRGEHPHVLVDPGQVHNELGEACFDSLAEAMERDGFQMEDVGLIIGTHSHPDHIEAIDAIVAKSGALVTLSREEYEYYRRATMQFYRMLGARSLQATPFFYLREGELSLGAKNRVNLQVLSTPGHSPGSISLYWKEEKILISGDVVFFSSIGRTDFPGGSTALLQQSIDRLSQLDVECLVPGHSTEMGSIVSGKQKVERNFRMIKMMFFGGV